MTQQDHFFATYWIALPNALFYWCYR